MLFIENGELVLIGIPDVGTPSLRVLNWLPYSPATHCETGETVEEVAEDFRRYFETVGRWSSFFDNNFEPHTAVEDYGKVVDPRSEGVDYLFKRPLAKTLADGFLGMEMQFSTYVKATDGSGRPLKRRRLGNLLLLPPPTEVSLREAIELLIRHRYGILGETEPPAWLSAYKLPFQVPIEGEISSLEEAIAGLYAKRESCNISLENESRFLKLLYEQHEDGLESIVRDALRSLGAEVTDPASPGREDGTLVESEGRNALLEIKGRTGSLKRIDVRQAYDWVVNAIAEDDWEGKGLLITNAHCSRTPAERPSPYPPDCVTVASRFGLCLMTTVQLFVALCKQQEGSLDRDAFWDAIFETNGALELEGLELPNHDP